MLDRWTLNCCTYVYVMYDVRGGSHKIPREWESSDGGFLGFEKERRGRGCNHEGRRGDKGYLLSHMLSCEVSDGM